MADPLVSVCIGAYNREKYIRECVDSALSQSWPNKEIIVVDDASTDGTRDILKSYGSSIRLILRDQNSGICPITRNEAIGAASGDLIAFLDSDDVWYAGKLEKQVEFLLAHPNIPLVHTLSNVINASSAIVMARHDESLVPQTGMIFDQLLIHCWITISSVMARRWLFSTVGLFNADPPYGYLGEDLEFFLRVAKSYPIGLVSERLTGFRKAGQGITAKNWRSGPEPVPLFQALLKRRDIWQECATLPRMKRALTDKCDENAYYWRQKRCFSRAAWNAWQSIRAAPLDMRGWKHLMASGLHRP